MKDIIKINEEAESCQTKQVKTNSIQMIKIGNGNGNSNSNVFNYSKVLEVLLSIQKTSNSDEFAIDFGDKTEEIKLMIIDTIEMIKRKDTPVNIKINLEKIKVFIDGVGESILTTGICTEITKVLK